MGPDDEAWARSGQDFFGGAVPGPAGPVRGGEPAGASSTSAFGTAGGFGSAPRGGAARVGAPTGSFLGPPASANRSRRTRRSPVRALGITGPRVVALLLIAGVLVVANDYRVSWTARARTQVVFPDQLAGFRLADAPQVNALLNSPGAPALPSLGGGTGSPSPAFYLGADSGLQLMVLAAKKPPPLLPFDLGGTKKTAVDHAIGASDAAPVQGFTTLDPGAAGGRLVCMTLAADRLCAGDNDTSVTVLVFSNRAVSDEVVVATRNTVLGFD